MKFKFITSFFNVTKCIAFFECYCQLFLQIQGVDIPMKSLEILAKKIFGDEKRSSDLKACVADYFMRRTGKAGMNNIRPDIKSGPQKLNIWCSSWLVFFL